jgi:hypothetical protein
MKLEMIIPHRDNDGSDNAAVIESSIRALCAKFGGVTVYDAKGFWVNPEGRLYQDDVAVLVSAALSQEQESVAADLRALAREVLAATDQEAVFLSVAGQAEIIE